VLLQKPWYTVTALLVCAASAGSPGQQWQEPRSHEQLLPDSVDCWEPALATAPNGNVYVVAGKRHGMPRDKDFEQQQVIWRSEDGGKTFEGSRPLTNEGLTHYDQRIAVDAKGGMYVSYIGNHITYFINPVPMVAARGRRDTSSAPRHARNRQISRTTTTSSCPRQERTACAQYGWMIAAARSTCGPAARPMPGARGGRTHCSQIAPTGPHISRRTGSKRSMVITEARPLTRPAGFTQRGAPVNPAIAPVACG